MVKNLKKLREENKLSQQALAEKLGITQQAVYKYERTVIEPDIETLIKLANIFHVSVDYLIGNCDEKPYLDISGYDRQHLDDWHKLPVDIRQIHSQLIKETIKKLK